MASTDEDDGWRSNRAEVDAMLAGGSPLSQEERAALLREIEAGRRAEGGYDWSSALDGRGPDPGAVH